MDNRKTLKVKIAAIGSGKYSIAVVTPENTYVNPESVRRLLFSWDEASFYGTRLTVDAIDTIPVFIVNAWVLLNLFAKEGFNSFIDWEWSELSSLCLSAAPVLHEAIEKGVPVPDFTSLQNEQVGWTLPEEVLEEFVPAFWEEKVYTDIHAENEETKQAFIEAWYNDAANAYLSGYSSLKNKWDEALTALKDTRLTADELQTFFDEESWSAWLGIEENANPFVIGLKLTEPIDGVGPWNLTTFLRSKKEENIVIDYPAKRLPRGWNKYASEIKRTVQRWVSVIPWLGNEANGFKDELSEPEAWDFLTDASEKLLFLGAEILLPSWWMALKESSLKVRARVKSSSNRGPSYVGLQALMDFDWRFSLNGEDLSEAEFQNLVNEKRRLVYIRGQWVKLDPQFIKQIQELMETANDKGLQLTDLLQQEFMNEQDEVEDDDTNQMLQIQFELNQELRKMVSRLRETKNIPILPAPKTFQGELRPYQSLGMSWLLFLREHGFGACLADDMGLGKTVQMITYLQHVKELQHTESTSSIEVEEQAVAVAPQAIVETQENEDDVEGSTTEDVQDIQKEAIPVQASLIICPTSVLGNWQRELERFSPNLKVHLHYGTTRVKGEAFVQTIAKYDIVLTSYGITHHDFDALSSVYWNTIILDEAQNIKNSQTKQSRSVRKFKGRHHVALTGTPMENRLSELWAIFDFINKGYLGSLKQFSDKYVATIEREDQKDKIKELQRLITPFLLRRTKKDKDVALNLPDKQEQKEYVPLTTEQASLYEQLIKDTFTDIEKLSAFEKKGIILKMLNKLKQLCNHPALYLKEDATSDIMAKSKRSGKLEKLTELIDAVQENQESCLIFTQYIGMGNMMKELLEKRYNIEVPFLNGSASKAQRDTMISRFQAGEFPIFILSLKAGGTGLNLTTANHVIHYDRWWNPAVENQATDRAYRIGQKRFVHVHKLICTGTLEEKIDSMIDKKQALNDEIINSDNWITELSTDEIRDLVSLH
ncbi:DEAD/DEAH box helicase [Peribacillus loiseleuriae]|uniref:ATP-dependent helicase n=1 Tax=Peribacillus loiseleuriae TaxID=1679170 RepID=A0A0K9GYX6_9BACI|nr:DEAD/DEAH box helicase [Peribacillus loiseleuriae]KMY51929.1 ATP-dependent helicase [Peribacillus loiseleuriae]